MKKLVYMMAFLAMASQLTDCKKSNDDDEDEPTPVNQLCDGKGGSTWMPSDSTNTWSYEFTIAGMHQSSPTLVAGSTSTHDSKTYRRITDSSNLMFLDDYEIREDASHNMYRYYDFDGSEYLEVPGSPTLNQSWPLYSGRSRKVTDLNASLTTDGCNYTGLLKIAVLDNNQNPVQYEYFKKGLGLVKSEQPGTFGNVYELTSVSLK